MRALRLNHVSVGARDLDESAAFYEGLLGMTRLPTPDFGFPVVWLRLGDVQLHLFHVEDQGWSRQHFAVDVDDFNGVYAWAAEHGCLDAETFGGAVREHPAGWLQLYLRDPSGNLVEIDTGDPAAVDRTLVDTIVPLTGQAGEAAAATLYHRQSARA